jgi:hypothetical protein
MLFASFLLLTIVISTTNLCGAFDPKSTQGCSCGGAPNDLLDVHSWKNFLHCMGQEQCTKEISHYWSNHQLEEQECVPEIRKTCGKQFYNFQCVQFVRTNERVWQIIEEVVQCISNEVDEIVGKCRKQPQRITDSTELFGGFA